VWTTRLPRVVPRSCLPTRRHRTLSSYWWKTRTSIWSTLARPRSCKHCFSLAAYTTSIWSTLARPRSCKHCFSLAVYKTVHDQPLLVFWHTDYRPDLAVEPRLMIVTMLCIFREISSDESDKLTFYLLTYLLTYLLAERLITVDPKRSTMRMTTTALCQCN